MKNAKAIRTLLGEHAEALTGFRDIAHAYKSTDLTPDIRAKIEAILTLALELTEARLNTREPISSWSSLIAYLMPRMADLDREQFRVLFLDRKNNLISDEILGHGTVDHAPVYPREVVRRALELNASAMILAHNHPSGDPSPSTADVDMTKLICDAAKTLDIAVHDHIVIAAKGHVSLRQRGLM
jgi:DNA repair protein RadC